MPTLSISIKNKLWKKIVKQRGEMEMSEFKHVILALLFLRFLSYSFEQLHVQLGETGRNQEDKKIYESKNVYWLPKESRWSFITDNASEPDIANRINHAMKMIEKENIPLQNVLSMNFSRPELQAENLKELIEILSFEVDQLGIFSRVFDYFLKQFARALGTSGGEFYIPESIASLLTEMIRPIDGRVFDPTCGSGGMLIQSSKFEGQAENEQSNITLYGQEMDQVSWSLAKMNLAIRGINADLRNRATNPFHEDEHKELKADYILANVPINNNDWGGDKLQDPEYWKFGIPPERNANYAWVQHIVSKLAQEGTAGFVLANSSMSTNMTAEFLIRKKLIDEDLVECIVTLPGQLLYSTQMPICLWFISRKKNSTTTHDRSGEILFIDARRIGKLVAQRNKEFTTLDIQSIATPYNAWRGVIFEQYEDITGFSKVVKVEEVMRNEYNLTPGLYVGCAGEE